MYAGEHLKSIGRVAYLKLPFCEIEKRIDNLPTRGVVIREGKTLFDMYKERAPLYEKYADITVRCDEESLSANVDKITRALSLNS